MGPRFKFLRERGEADERLINGILSRAFVVMSPIQYKYFSAYHIGGFSQTVIADKYGVTHSTVSQVINRAERVMIKKWG